MKVRRSRRNVLGYTESQGRSSKAREKYIQYEFLPPKAAENLQLPPPLFFEKYASKGGGS